MRFCNFAWLWVGQAALWISYCSSWFFVHHCKADHHHQEHTKVITIDISLNNRRKILCLWPEYSSLLWIEIDSVVKSGIMLRVPILKRGQKKVMSLCRSDRCIHFFATGTESRPPKADSPFDNGAQVRLASNKQLTCLFYLARAGLLGLDVWCRWQAWRLFTAY